MTPPSRMTARSALDNSNPPVAPWRRSILERLDASGRYPKWVLFAALAGMFSTTFPITILAVSLAPIADEFGAAETTMAWVISGPMLLSAVTFPLLGKLGDLRGQVLLRTPGAQCDGLKSVPALGDQPQSIGPHRTGAA